MPDHRHTAARHLYRLVLYCLYTKLYLFMDSTQIKHVNTAVIYANSIRLYNFLLNIITHKLTETYNSVKVQQKCFSVVSIKVKRKILIFWFLVPPEATNNIMGTGMIFRLREQKLVKNNNQSVKTIKFKI